MYKYRNNKQERESVGTIEVRKDEEVEWRVIPDFHTYELSRTGLVRNNKWAGQKRYLKVHGPVLAPWYSLRRDNKSFNRSLTTLWNITFPDLTTSVTKDFVEYRETYESVD